MENTNSDAHTMPVQRSNFRHRIRALPGTVLCCISMISLCFLPLLGQNPGDHFTAGYDHGRSSFHPHPGDLSPPLEPVRTVEFEGVTDAHQLMVFDEYLLVWETDDTTIRYHLFEEDSEDLLWSQDFPADFLIFHPAYSQDVLLLGKSDGIQAVRVSTGEVLWTDETIGSPDDRFPILSGDLALYHGEEKVVAADSQSGEVLWEIEMNTAPMPLAQYGNRVYVADANGALHALRVTDGEEAWSADIGVLQHDFFVATEGRVFVMKGSASSDAVCAIDARDGTVIWEMEEFGVTVPLLAYSRLYLVGGFVNRGEITAFEAGTGTVEWKTEEEGLLIIITPPPGRPLFHPVIADHTLYYYNVGLHRIQARDISTGSLVWTLPLPGTESEDQVRDLVAADQELFILFNDRVEVYAPSHEIYFPHLADGMGQSTVISLANPNPTTVQGQIEFLSSEGEPLVLSVDGTPTSTVPLEIPAGGAAEIETDGGEVLQSGWARVRPEKPVHGSSIFRVSGPEGTSLFEAGIGDARASSRASVAVLQEEGLETGIALANPNNQAVEVNLTLLDSDGAVAEETVEIPAGGQLARFIAELFSDHLEDGFRGALLIESAFPVAATALRTQDGFQMSSYPVAEHLR